MEGTFGADVVAASADGQLFKTAGAAVRMTPRSPLQDGIGALLRFAA